MRESMALEIDRNITPARVIEVLAELFVVRGVAGQIRSDNEAEFIAHAIQASLRRPEVQTLYVGPGTRQENGYAESFHSRLCDESTKCQEFGALPQTRRRGDAWRQEYNHRPPHTSLRYQSPADLAAGCGNAPLGPTP